MLPGISATEHEVMRQAAAEFMRSLGNTSSSGTLYAGMQALTQPAPAPVRQPVRGLYCQKPRPRPHPSLRHPLTAMATETELRAAMFTGTLWAAIWHAGRQRHRHYPGAYDPAWLASLPLPSGDRGLVTLLDEHREDFEHHPDGSWLEAAYAARPRTRMRSDIGWDDEGSWYALAARHLGRLAEEDGPVVCSLFTSQTGDESLGAHWDGFHGASVQLSGAKCWLAGQPPELITTVAGDILILPKGTLHEVTTPASPGHSVHLAFALDRDREPQEGVCQR